MRSLKALCVAAAGLAAEASSAAGRILRPHRRKLAVAGGVLLLTAAALAVAMVWPEPPTVAATAPAARPPDPRPAGRRPEGHPGVRELRAIRRPGDR
jgi:hypothetical protein